MRIITGNYYGKNIQFVCEYCNCVYEVESKKDWNIRKVRLFWSDYIVPKYSVRYPNCKGEKTLGYDPDDLKDSENANTFCPWIPLLKQRDDWNERYKVEKIKAK